MSGKKLSKANYTKPSKSEYISLAETQTNLQLVKQNKLHWIEFQSDPISNIRKPIDLFKESFATSYGNSLGDGLGKLTVKFIGWTLAIIMSWIFGIHPLYMLLNNKFHFF